MTYGNYAAFWPQSAHSRQICTCQCQKTKKFQNSRLGSQLATAEKGILHTTKILFFECPPKLWTRAELSCLFVVVGAFLLHRVSRGQFPFPGRRWQQQVIHVVCFDFLINDPDDEENINPDPPLLCPGQAEQSQAIWQQNKQPLTVSRGWVTDGRPWLLQFSQLVSIFTQVFCVS